MKEEIIKIKIEGITFCVSKEEIDNLFDSLDRESVTKNQLNKLLLKTNSAVVAEKTVYLAVEKKVAIKEMILSDLLCKFKEAYELKFAIAYYLANKAILTEVEIQVAKEIFTDDLRNNIPKLNKCDLDEWRESLGL